MLVVHTNEKKNIYDMHIYFFVKTIKCIFNNKQVFDHRVLRNKIHEDNQV